jgi:hypothetical protein
MKVTQAEIQSIKSAVMENYDSHLDPKKQTEILVEMALQTLQIKWCDAAIAMHHDYIDRITKTF